jgi:hypothetical protein
LWVVTPAGVKKLITLPMPYTKLFLINGSDNDLQLIDIRANNVDLKELAS